MRKTVRLTVFSIGLAAGATLGAGPAVASPGAHAPGATTVNTHILHKCCDIGGGNPLGELPVKVGPIQNPLNDLPNPFDGMSNPFNGDPAGMSGSGGIRDPRAPSHRHPRDDDYPSIRRPIHRYPPISIPDTGMSSPRPAAGLPSIDRPDLGDSRPAAGPPSIDRPDTGFSPDLPSTPANISDTGYNGVDGFLNGVGNGLASWDPTTHGSEPTPTVFDDPQTPRLPVGKNDVVGAEILTRPSRDRAAQCAEGLSYIKIRNGGSRYELRARVEDIDGTTIWKGNPVVRGESAEGDFPVDGKQTEITIVIEVRNPKTGKRMPVKRDTVVVRCGQDITLDVYDLR